MTDVITLDDIIKCKDLIRKDHANPEKYQLHIHEDVYLADQKYWDDKVKDEVDIIVNGEKI